MAENNFLPTCVPIPVPEEDLEDLTVKAKDWAIIHGASMRSKVNFNEESVQFVPFVLFPSAFPRSEFNKVVELQTVFQDLVHRVSLNRDFLTNCLKNTILVDEFTGNLFKIYETVMEEGVTQPISLGLLRSDYMLHLGSLKQVEVNTIASSFAGIATTISQLNRYVLQQINQSYKLDSIPDNKAVSGLSQGMLEAWKIYGNPKGAILFVVEDVTYNICDQRFHEFEINKIFPQIKVLRRTLTEIGDKASLNENKELIIGTHIISVVYFRSGYEPGHYPTQKEWNARLLMEKSKAIKCPTIQYHLAGTKKVQQALAKSGALELFLSDPKKIEAVRAVFVGLYGLDFDELGDQAVQMALETPEKFVLKPQREGGGNNIYGTDVRNAVNQMKNSKERTAWILMERLLPPVSKGYIVRPGGPNVPPVSDVISELGIFGVIIGDAQKILLNKQVGHMLRTKVSTENEGGVTAGAGALDAPFLID